MQLVNDEFEETWVWVTKHDHNLELSPHFDSREYAVQWLKYIKEHIDGANG